MKYRILVVEDNPLNRELLCDWLETEGYEVLKATDLKTARVAVEEESLDAVLLDVQLGPENGLSLAEWIRRQPALCHIPVIAVTAHAMALDQDRILKAGCNTCVSKPIDFRVLDALLRRWLAAAQ